MKRRPQKISYDITPFILARMEKRWSRAQLGFKVNRSEAMIWMLENGERRLTERMAFAMSKALNVPMSKVTRVRESAA